CQVWDSSSKNYIF
nr:immunoglobulin light chain junction region [Macaca mulatta]MPO05802.1 immunoglobulin light chain junction region [Macaca mulatta]MPO07195.1 immunoglobulin light chain junction region [Macaca mulatta]